MSLGRVGVIVAARTSSTRLPGKALLPLQGLAMIVFLMRRLRPTKSGTIVLATTSLPADDRLADLVRAEGMDVYRGHASDLVARYVEAADHFGFDTVVRVTADCPFVDAELIDWCIAAAKRLETFDIATTKGRFPVGLDAEIYSAARMKALHERAELSAAHREHLTLYLYEHPSLFRIERIEPPATWPKPDAQFTVDTRADYDLAQGLADSFERYDFSVSALLERVAA